MSEESIIRQVGERAARMLAGRDNEIASLRRELAALRATRDAAQHRANDLLLEVAEARRDAASQLVRGDMFRDLADRLATNLTEQLARADAVERDRDYFRRLAEDATRICDKPGCTSAIVRRDDGHRMCGAGHASRWVDAADLTAARTEVARLRGALAWYADPATWEATDGPLTSQSSATWDGGDQARAALATPQGAS